MKNSYDVYLAGAMTGRKVKDVLAERHHAHQVLRDAGLTYYCPAADEGLEILDQDAVISTSYDFDKMKAYVKKDLAAVAASRAVIHLSGDRISDGAIWEMGFAVYHRQIPVILVAPNRQMGKTMGFSNVLADAICYNVEEAVIELKKRLEAI
jgi:nucleoside 2-deoxyribosyltransferase